MAKNSLKNLNGWIDEVGEFHPCDYGTHSKVFPYESRKRIKISSYDGGTIFVLNNPTQAQINTVHEWCEENQRIDLWEKFQENYME